MSQREERFEVRVDASPDDLWWALTTEEGLRSWFGVRASIDARVGGTRMVGWGEAAIDGQITEMEPGVRLRVVYLVEGEEAGAEEWLIAGEGTITRLTLINSMPDEGIEDWEGFYGDMRRGWRLFLASLRHALGEAERRTRHVEFRALPAPGDRTSVRLRLDAAVTTAGPLLEGMEPSLVDRPHSLLLVRPDRTLLLDIEGAGEGQVVFAQAAVHGGPESWCSEILDAIESGYRVAG